MKTPVRDQGPILVTFQARSAVRDIEKEKNQSSVKRSDCLLHGSNTHYTNDCNTLGSQDECTKQTYVAWEKTEDQQKKSTNSGNSHINTTYNHSGQKAEMNAMVQQENEAAISSSVKNAKAAKKMISED